MLFDPCYDTLFALWVSVLCHMRCSSRISYAVCSYVGICIPILCMWAWSRVLRVVHFVGSRRSWVCGCCGGWCSEKEYRRSGSPSVARRCGAKVVPPSVAGAGEGSGGVREVSDWGTFGGTSRALETGAILRQPTFGVPVEGRGGGWGTTAKPLQETPPRPRREAPLGSTPKRTPHSVRAQL